jgi:hypothetical protein
VAEWDAAVTMFTELTPRLYHCASTAGDHPMDGFFMVNTGE